ncbi:MAG: C-GCAxxG-C-C family protein [Eubacteriales bacterium]|nr:C-GCAxxG-C-C family protein [Eubacteriales bacterium]
MGDELKMTAEEIQVYFAKGIDCGQVVLLALSDQLSISRDEAMRLGAGLGGGMFDGDTCGAYFAGITAVGLKYGPTGTMDEAEFQAAKGQTMLSVLKFKAAFRERFGDTGCRKLLGYKIPEEMNEAIESGRMMSFCPQLVSETIDMLDALFNEEKG